MVDGGGLNPIAPHQTRVERVQNRASEALEQCDGDVTRAVERLTTDDDMVKITGYGSPLSQDASVMLAGHF